MGLWVQASLGFGDCGWGFDGEMGEGGSGGFVGVGFWLG